MLKLPFPPVLIAVYATVKSRHAEQCRVSPAHVPQYSLAAHRGWEKGRKEKKKACVSRGASAGSRLVFGETAEQGLRGFFLGACHMLSAMSVSGRLSGQAEASYQKSYLRSVSLAQHRQSSSLRAKTTRGDGTFADLFRQC